MKITIKNLSFGYRKTPILKGVNIEVAQGKLCVLLGANGAGKSTLIKCVNGILTPEKGEIYLDTTDLLGLPQKEKSRRIGYVPQSTEVEDSGLNVFEMVLSGRVPHMKGRMKDADYEIVRSVLEKMSLSGYSTKLLNQLSGGERQRVFIARALAQEPVIMLLDEPTSNLDLRYQLETMEIVRGLCQDKGMTIMAVIHDVNTAVTFADQVVLMKDGNIHAAGHPDEILNTESLEHIFDVRVEFAAYQDKQYVIPRRCTG